MTGPPEYDDYDPAPPETFKKGSKKSADKTPARQLLDPRSEALRTAWIDSVRQLHQRRTGCPSRYNSNVTWDGGRVADNSRKGFREYKPLWPKVVAHADASGLTDPVDLVRALFAKWAGDNAPTPTLLVSPQTIESARNIHRSRQAQVALALRAEEAVFRTAAWAQGMITPNPHEAVAFVLNDIGRDLSPLFRYSLAVVRGLPTVADRWRAAAEGQLMSDPGAYLSYWAAILPPDLQRAAAPAARTA